ncbi:hypothetical protein [Acidithiobacillus ferrianus]|uniref:hypothetical protein n=1 Tax=Acidithiobacillus ferrianus TaxID=2678518 RepID=UPI0034E44444
MNESYRTDMTAESLKLLKMPRKLPEKSLILAALMAANTLVSAHAAGTAASPKSGGQDHQDRQTEED